MKKTTFISIILSVFFACNQTTVKEQRTPQEIGRVYVHPEWSKNINIYEVNIRQYTKEGTFAAFKEHIPRLKAMGIDVLWFMPIHPVSKKNKKGELGSYYSVGDYQKVNPDFGTIEEFKELVSYIHEQGMNVLIDWVTNHSGWDNWLVDEHPDWYTKDSVGNVTIPAGTDWTDVADFNYDNSDLREYMTQSLEYWVREADIDGYRCDMAGMVPLDFWINVRKRLDSIKPVLMLAEWESPEYHVAFDISYAWEIHHKMNAVAQGKENVLVFDEYFAKIDSTYSRDDYILNFTSNHDENSWQGSVFERMGDATEAMAVFSATIPGVPLLYSGQEAGLDKRLSFFGKDEIDWSNLKYEDFYTKLFFLKRENKALWNGSYGGSFERLVFKDSPEVYAYAREKDDNNVVVILNFSKEAHSISFPQELHGSYHSLFADDIVVNDTPIEMDAWGYRVLIKKQ